MMKFNHPQTNDNKYTRGVVNVIAGCKRYPGAAVLASQAAFAASRSGAGYVHVFTHVENVRTVQSYKPSLVVSSFDELGSDGWQAFASTSHKPQVCVIGPGFDASESSLGLIVVNALDIDAPLVIDGGALGFLTNDQAVEHLRRRAERGYITILTPHGGEAAKLAQFVGVHTRDEALAMDLANAYHGFVALKGPVTYVSEGSQVSFMTQGTPSCAKAGTGDVLAGIVGALLLKFSQGPTEESAFDMVYKATLLHAKAAHVAEEKMGDISLMPEDIIESIPEAIRRIEAEE